MWTDFACSVGNIKAQKCINELLELELQPFAHDLFQDNKAFTFQQDSALCYVVRVFRFQVHHVQLLE